MTNRNNSEGEIQPIRSKTEPIPRWMIDPMQGDERFTRAIGGVSIFLAEGLEPIEDHNGTPIVPGATYNFASLLKHEFHYQKMYRSQDIAEHEVGNSNTAAYYEAYLRCLFDDPTIQLQHIVVGFDDENPSQSFRGYGTYSERYDANNPAG